MNPFIALSRLNPRVWTMQNEDYEASPQASSETVSQSE